MTYNNYSISRGKGKLYLKSQTPQEGYEEVIFGENQKTYHKYFDRIQGVLKYFDEKEAQTKEGKKLRFLEVTLVDGDIINKVSVPLKNSKGNYTDEVKALVSALNNADVGEPMQLSVTTKYWESNGKSGENLNIYLNYINRKNEDGKGLSTGFINFNDIPKAEREDDEDLGVSYNWKPVNKFFVQKIKEIQAKFQNTTAREGEPTDPPPADDEHLGTTPKNPKPGGKQMPTMSPSQAFEPVVENKIDLSDQLPF